MDPEKTVKEAVSEIPMKFVIVQFSAALTIIIKGIITILKEKKAKTEDSRKKNSKKRSIIQRGINIS